MKIKTSELFCASPASTAICTSMNHHAMVRRSSGGSTPRPINRRHHNYYNNHYQFDFGDKPTFKTPLIPCTSQQHIDPKPYKNRKSDGGGAAVKSSGRGLSSRYLLDNPIFVEDFKDSGGGCNGGALVVSEPSWPDYRDDSPGIKKSLLSRRARGDGSLVFGESRSLILLDEAPAPAESHGSKSSRSRSSDQVVELRVSIHCKGCEGKVRKHISRMEGVRSFHIDLESKKVIVIGEVTPLSVLASISKVKSAQFWPSPSTSSLPPPFVSVRY